MDLRSILQRTFSAWNDHDASTISAALAFYSILSLAPLILLVTPLIALVFGHSAAQDQIVAQVRNTIGPAGAEAIRGLLEQPQKPSTGILASVIGIITLLFGASGVFAELRAALNTIWDVKPVTGAGLAGLIEERFATFGMVLGVGFLLLVSLLLSAATAAMGKFFTGYLPAPEFKLHLIDDLISFAGISVLFGLIFKYVPERKIDWKDMWIGAVATSFLFTIGKFLIGLYLGKAAIGSAYGASGSMIAVIVWVYYSSLIFLFGAEFTHELASGI
jgi:membrane protein